MREVDDRTSYHNNNNNSKEQAERTAIEFDDTYTYC